MVAPDQVDPAVQGIQDLRRPLRTVPGDIAQVPDLVLRSDDLVPVGDQSLIVLPDVLERPVVIAQDVAVTKILQ